MRRSKASIGNVTSEDKACTTKRYRVFFAVSMALSLLAAVPASAQPLNSDLVDGKTAVVRRVPLAGLPDVTMKSGALVDGEGRVLWARDPDAKRPMASITKIMTAVVALEHSSLDDKVTIPKASMAVGESTANLREGERLPMRDVLAALLVKSGNDAGVAIANKVGGNEVEFVKMMNAKAADLGLTDTHFENPHGLDESGHYSTADDLAVLARYAMSKPEFRAIVSMKSVHIGTGRRRELLESTDALIGNYPGAIGVKTGFTNGAGHSIVSAAQRRGLTLYAVVLGTSSDAKRFREARELLDWGFAHYRPQSLATSGTVVAVAPVADYLDVTVPAALSADTTASILDVDGPITRTVTVASMHAPVTVGETVGVATFTQAGRIVARVGLSATQRVRRPNPFQWTWIAMVRVWRRMFGASVADVAGAFAGNAR